MGFTSVCIKALLGLLTCSGPVLANATLRVSPERSQFFKYHPISLTCEEQNNSTAWQVKRRTTSGSNGTCNLDWGALTGLSCIIKVPYPWDNGLYWCESDFGELTPSINITVADGPVIMESPLLPVTEGDNVTLRCRTKAALSNLSADFYKDGFFIRTESTGKMTIHIASKSDEGLYKCNISELGESPESWLAVRAYSDEERRKRKLEDVIVESDI
ncbi:Fc receptor-like protein 5 [Lampris incognitus]|uniref:Fc receptor-like protein 5 n=1 Tax=Lampris incognitus TaxID=2546036 RepID=UPI0024B5B527|nr:Fc receptor-like protein 5 [Lampris incognitus]